jgi:multidrug resistance efflux pump
MEQTQTQERTGAGGRGRAEATNGAASLAEVAPRRSNPAASLRAAIFPAIIVSLGICMVLGFLALYDRSLYVTTDIAQITGPTIEVTSPGVGLVRTVEVDVGDHVSADQVIATLGIPRQLWLRAPVDGIVVARDVNPGDTVASGRSIVTIADPTKIWIQAQVDETSIGRVRPGQRAEVTIDAFGTTLPGRVMAVGRAAASYLRPSTNGGGSLVKARQFVPVKIDLDYGDLPLVLGGSVAVKIRVVDE